VAQKYVEVANARSGSTEHGSADSGIAITGVNLLDESGLVTTRAELGKPLVFDVEFEARGPVSDVLFSLHIDRGQQRVYDSDTRSLGIDLGTLSGKGVLRCEIPDLSLMPNSYGIQVVIYTNDSRPLSHLKRPHMFTIFVPQDLRKIGCALDDEPDRGFVYGRASWRKLPPQSSIDVLTRKVS